MDIRIYQVDMEKDQHRVAFASLEGMKKYSGRNAPDPSIYENVFEGNVECKSLEDVYVMFNTERRPSEFRGHSLSVSDIIEVRDGEQSKFHYCDSWGFKEVKFDPSLTYKTTDLLKVVLLEPDKEARIVEIGSGLRNLQCVVQGQIEAVALSERDNVRLICNEEGKLMDLPPNRALRDPDNNVVTDVIVGTCFICGVNKGDFVSLTDKQLEQYKEMFLKPQEFTKNMWGEWKAASSLVDRIKSAENKGKENAPSSEKVPLDKKER